MRGMRIDLHTHTSAHSSDSNITPGGLMALARERGLDGVVLTEHDRLWPWEGAARLADDDFIVLAGVEVTTELGHVLVYGLPSLEAGLHRASALRAACDAAKALMFLAHPARNGAVAVGPEELATLFDGVEGINGSDGAMQSQASSGASSLCRLPPIGGSDTHAAHEVALAATEFEAEIRSVADLLRALRTGQYCAMSLG